MQSVLDKKFIFSRLAVLGSLALVLFSAPLSSEEKPETEQKAKSKVEQIEKSEQETIQTLPLDELATLADVYLQIKKVYYKELSDEEILQNAIKGMLSNLDPHSLYMESDNFQDLEESARGEYAGIGIRAEHRDDAIYVRYIFDESPAQRSGLKLNDKIIAVDGVTTEGLDSDAGSDMLRGKPNSKVTLTIVSEENDSDEQSEETSKDIVVTRKLIKFSTVNSELLEKNIGFVRVGEFQTRTAKDITQAITKMEKENKAPLQGLILDLRNNPGGILDAAVAVADLFLHEGIIVSTKGRIAESNSEHTATSGDILRNRKLVVLINDNSASASEIVAGALQDHKRAEVIGTQSYGKGSVQTVYPIPGKGGIKLTTALYYTPNDRSIHGKGITPNSIVEFKRATDTAETKKDNQKESETKKEDDYKKDNQVVFAVEFLTKPLNNTENKNPTKEEN